MNGEKLREGIFSLNTRRFGTVSEIIIQLLEKYGESQNNFHDLFDDANKYRIEVKFSRVLKSNKTKIKKGNILKCIQEEISDYRLVPFSDWNKHRFDCNIQQVKKDQFEILYYGLFFADVLLIFRINSYDINHEISYSDKQHKGNIGEGQFHIHQDNLDKHIDRYLYKKITYDNLYTILNDAEKM